MVSAPHISLEKEGQVYYSNNILLNLETIFKMDNQKLVYGEPDKHPHFTTIKCSEFVFIYK